MGATPAITGIVILCGESATPTSAIGYTEVVQYALAEAEGFEPSRRRTAYQFSKLAPSPLGYASIWRR